MPYYAQLTDGIVTAVTETHSEINLPNMIKIDSMDEQLLNKIYYNGEFVTPVSND